MSSNAHVPHEIHALGSFVLNPDNQDLAISLNEKTRFETFHPGKGLLDEPLMTQSAIGTYGTAQSIEELQQSVPHIPRLFWALFELAATFPSLTGMDIDLTRQHTPHVYLHCPKGDKFAYWILNANRIFVIGGQEKTPATLPKNFNPGELLYCLSIVAEHIRLGSQRFAIRVDEENERLMVSFFDHEIQNHRCDITLPLMTTREVNVQ